MMTIKIFLLILILNTVQSKTYKRCDFIEELVERFNFKEEDAVKISCIAEAAAFETHRVIYYPEWSWKKTSYGIFQIISEFECSETGIGGICNLNCEDLIDDDISDDIECLKKNERHYVRGYTKPCHCDEQEIIDNCAKNKNSDNKIWISLDDCFTKFPKHLFCRNSVSPFASSPAEEYDFPHAAAIGWSRSESNDVKWDCGGFLISEDMILTAAHCTINRERKEPDVVRLGALDLREMFKKNNDQQFGISSIIRHPDYASRYNDIALIKLDKKVTITRAVVPACLWTKHEIPHRVPLEACGYGQTEFEGRSSLTLMKVNLSVTGIDECQTHFENNRLLKHGLEERIHLCANDETGRNMDTCDGDSGGPLEMKLKFPVNSVGQDYEIPFVVGVTAFGKGCGFYSPGVYTRVSTYIDWIKQHVPDFEVDPIKCSEKFLKLRKNSRGRSTSWRDFHPQKIIISTSDGQTSKATIIADKFLLTTASSLNKTSFNPDRVQLSSNSGQIIIDEIIYHPNFVQGRSDNDLALIKLKFRIWWIHHDYPTCLSKKNSEDVLFQQETYFSRSTGFGEVSQEFNQTNCQEKEDVMCLNNGHYMVPNVCDVLQGSPVFSSYIPGVLNGFAIQSQDCTFTTAMNISKHYDWINSVVFGTLDQNTDDQSQDKLIADTVEKIVSFINQKFEENHSFPSFRKFFYNLLAKIFDETT